MSLEILFVDDEPNVLAGLRRMLFAQRGRWEMRFACGGEEALRMLAERAADVVVTDMRMPGMDGAELLSRVELGYPGTARIVLSGQCDRETSLRAVGPTHMFLSKPCDGERLVRMIGRVCRLREELAEAALLDGVDGLRRLPSPPQIYLDLVAELRKPDASVNDIAAIIGRDIALSTKLLQIANSSFFGVGREIATPLQALHALGTDVVRSLVLKCGLVGQFASANLNTQGLDGIVEHGAKIGALTRRIWRDLGLASATPDEAFVAGMLHDIGGLALAAIEPAKVRQIDAECAATGAMRHSVERRILGVTHALVGGHLLSVWGLPDQLVSAACYHHEPARCGHQEVDLHTAVHLANALLAPGDFARDADHAYLSELGIYGWAAGWAERIAEEAKEAAL